MKKLIVMMCVACLCSPLSAAPVGTCPAVDPLDYTILLADDEDPTVVYACSTGVPIWFKCPDMHTFCTLFSVCIPSGWYYVADGADDYMDMPWDGYDDCKPEYIDRMKCPPGQYGTRTWDESGTNLIGCAQCPDGGTSDGGNGTTIDACHIPNGVTGSNTIGDYVYEYDCGYLP